VEIGFRAENPCVGDSIPPLATIDFAGRSMAESIIGASALDCQSIQALLQ
jgi:hypothetical protein